jgi:transposase-like protein
MSASRCRYGRSKICFMNAGSTSAMKRCAPGGTGLVRCLRRKSEKRERPRREIFLQWRRHLDEVFVRINGETHYLWRAVDHEGEVLESFVTKKRDSKSALRFLRKAMKRYGRPESIVTDKLRSYRAAMKVIGNEARQVTGRWLNNRAENSHQPFRRRERAMAKFRSIKSLQSTLQSTIISIKNVIFTTAEPSNSIEPQRFPSGGSC